MPLAGFEPAVPASERPQTHPLYPTASGIIYYKMKRLKYVVLIHIITFLLRAVALQPNSDRGRLIVENSALCTPGRTFYEWSTLHRDSYLNDTPQTRETDIHDCSGIWNRDPRYRATADLRHRPRGPQWSQLHLSFLYIAVMFYLS
jgi:hypothetical protein